MTLGEPPAADASPLIVLAQGGLLELLRVAGPRVVVPQAVAAEVRRHGPDDPAARALQTVAWIEIVDVASIDPRVQSFGLGPGEAEVLTWALAHPGTEAIIDDRSGRRAASALGVPTRGTLGLILAAKQQGLIPAARPVVEHLLRMTAWYLSDHERERALRLVGE